MTSTIKVNNIQNQCGANIANKCGSTITLGASGDTITLACGASQTGFGRTGTVDWDTTAKTASFTAVSGNGYFVNTTSGAITLTLPATPSAGDIVAFKDYAGTFGTNNLTIARNGSNLDGSASDKTINTNHTSMSLVYVDATQGWKSVEEGTGFIGEGFMVACGGTETTCGDYKIHTFTGPGTFTVNSLACSPANNVVDYLVVAGGAAGGFGDGAGGGAGGYRESSGAASGCYSVSPLGACVSGLPVSAQGYPITVGGGGTAPGSASPGGNGSNSIFSTITSAGGGGGGTTTPGFGSAGGSGGGSFYNQPTGGAGNTPPVSPPQGNPGGGGTGAAPLYGNAGGGGAGGAGNNGSPSCGGGDGGVGLANSITGTSVTRAGGGGGAQGGSSVPGAVGAGGPGGGGAGGNSTCTTGSGVANTGGGGGGSAFSAPLGLGGSGIVIIRYKYQ
jgi:hypothetical protein